MCHLQLYLLGIAPTRYCTYHSTTSATFAYKVIDLIAAERESLSDGTERQFHWHGAVNPTWALSLAAARGFWLGLGLGLGPPWRSLGSPGN